MNAPSALTIDTLLSAPPAADALGCYLLGPSVQHGFHHGSVLALEESPDDAAERSDSWCLRVAVRSGRSILRSCLAVGPYPNAGNVRELSDLASKQLFPAGVGITRPSWMARHGEALCVH